MEIPVLTLTPSMTEEEEEEEGCYTKKQFITLHGHAYNGTAFHILKGQKNHRSSIQSTTSPFVLVGPHLEFHLLLDLQPPGADGGALLRGGAPALAPRLLHTVVRRCHAHCGLAHRTHLQPGL